MRLLRSSGQAVESKVSGACLNPETAGTEKGVVEGSGTEFPLAH